MGNSKPAMGVTVNQTRTGRPDGHQEGMELYPAREASSTAGGRVMPAFPPVWQEAKEALCA